MHWYEPSEFWGLFRYRDVRYVLPFVLQVWLFATPIAYPSSLLDPFWRTLYGLNPMVGVVEGFRWALLGTDTAPGPVIAVSALMALLLGPTPNVGPGPTATYDTVTNVIRKPNATLGTRATNRVEKTMNDGSLMRVSPPALAHAGWPALLPCHGRSRDLR